MPRLRLNSVTLTWLQVQPIAVMAADWSNVLADFAAAVGQ